MKKKNRQTKKGGYRKTVCSQKRYEGSGICGSNGGDKISDTLSRNKSQRRKQRIIKPLILSHNLKDEEKEIQTEDERTDGETKLEVVCSFEKFAAREHNSESKNKEKEPVCKNKRFEFAPGDLLITQMNRRAVGLCAFRVKGQRHRGTKIQF